MKKDYLYLLLDSLLPIVEVTADILSEAIENNWPKDFVHNNIVHPCMTFMSVEHANSVHDTNANWAFGLSRYDELKLENKQ